MDFLSPEQAEQFLRARDHPLIALLLARVPTLAEGWPEDDRRRWVAAAVANLALVYHVEVPRWQADVDWEGILCE